MSKDKHLASGGTGILERLPSGDLIKTPTPNSLIPIEKKVFDGTCVWKLETIRELMDTHALPNPSNGVH